MYEPFYLYEIVCYSCLKWCNPMDMEKGIWKSSKKELDEEQGEVFVERKIQNMDERLRVER